MAALALSGKLASSSPGMNHVGAEIALECEYLGIEQLSGKHIYGSSNEIADALSRLDAPEASQLPASCIEAVCRSAPRRGPKWYRLPSAPQRPDRWGAGEEAEPAQAWRHDLV